MITELLFKGDQSEYGLCYSFWISTSTIFGITVTDANNTDSSFSSRLVLFILFLSGSVLFYSYSAFLTSALAIPNENLPFSNPEEIIKPFS